MHSQIQIETTQNVTVEYEIASVGERLLAGLIDLLVYLAYLFLFFMILKITSYNPGDVAIFLYFMPVYFYSLIMELSFNGQSLGKMVMKIRVVKKDGTPASLGAYLMRWLFRIVDVWMTSPLFGGIATITIIANGKGQRLGDIAAGTSVIRLKKRVKLSDTMYKKADENYVVTFPEAANLTDADINIIRNVYRQAMKKHQYEIVDELSHKVQKTLNVTPLMASEEFLRTIVKDYNHLMSEM